MVAILQKRRNISLQRGIVFKIKYLVVLLVLAFFHNQDVQAQKLSSISALDSAKIEYKLGRINKALMFLDAAEQIDASRQIKAEIYLYKARIYSLQLNAFMAEIYVNRFLVLRPFEKFDADEFIEITQTASKAKISPRISAGVSYGMNASNPVASGEQAIILSNEISTVNNQSYYYDYSYAINTEFYFRRNWSIYSEINNTTLNLTRTTYTKGLASNKMYFQFSNIQVPIGIKFDIFPIYFYTKYKPLNLSITSGAYVNKLISAKAYSGGFSDYQKRINSINVINYFNSLNYGFWTELAVAYRIKRLKFSLKIRNSYDLFNLNNSDNKYSIGTGDDIIFENYQVVDNFYFKYLSASIGINYYLRYKIFSDILKRKLEQKK